MKSVFLIFGCVASALAQDCSPEELFGRKDLGYQFRCDYHYVGSVEGWMKYHVIPATWRDARLRCHLEGTTLASPLNYALLAAIQNTVDQPGLLPEGIFTGIHATFSKGDYFTIEGVPLSHIDHSWAPGEPDNRDDNERCLVMNPDGTLADVDCNVPRPYVCYKMNDILEDVNDECGTVDSEYVYSNSTGSCYKFHVVPRTWSRAHMACSAEGGYLAIINGDDEAEVLRRLFAAIPLDAMVGDFLKDVAFVGFHNWGEHAEFLTVNGQTLEDAGYSKFYPGESNNLSTGEYCGAIYRTALMDDVWCDEHHAFICEKSPSSLLRDDEYTKK